MRGQGIVAGSVCCGSSQWVREWRCDAGCTSGWRAADSGFWFEMRCGGCKRSWFFM